MGRPKVLNPNEVSVKHGNETLLTPEQSAKFISDRVDAEFTVRQIIRLTDVGILEPVLIKGRRFYKEADLNDVILLGHVRPSSTNPNIARLVRVERRNGHKNGNRGQ